MNFRPALTAGQLAGVLVLICHTACPATPEVAERSLKDDSQTLVNLKLQIDRLTESLALANTEADYFHQKWLALRLKAEALGIESLTGNEKRLEEKAVALLGDLYRSEKRLVALEYAAQELLRAAAELERARTMERPAARAAYEAARRSLAALVENKQEGVEPAKHLNDGRVTLVDSESGLAVVNVGKMHGAVVGTPFRILDGYRVIGRCRLIEVRERLSAALIEDFLIDTTVQPGNRLLLDTVK